MDFEDDLPTTGFIWSRVKKHDKDLYEGNGKPSLTSRMGKAEDDLERIQSNMGKGIWLLVTILVTLIANLVLKRI